MLPNCPWPTACASLDALCASRPLRYASTGGSPPPPPSSKTQYRLVPIRSVDQRTTKPNQTFPSLVEPHTSKQAQAPRGQIFEILLSFCCHQLLRLVKVVRLWNSTFTESVSGLSTRQPKRPSSSAGSTVRVFAVVLFATTTRTVRLTHY